MGGGVGVSKSGRQESHPLPHAFTGAVSHQRQLWTSAPSEKLSPRPQGWDRCLQLAGTGAVGHTSGWEVPPREKPAPRWDASQGGSHFIAAPRRPWEGARHGRPATPRGHPSPPAPSLFVLRPRNVPAGSILPEHQPHLSNAEVALWEQGPLGRCLMLLPARGGSHMAPVSQAGTQPRTKLSG